MEHKIEAVVRNLVRTVFQHYCHPGPDSTRRLDNTTYHYFLNLVPVYWYSSIYFYRCYVRLYTSGT